MGKNLSGYGLLLFPQVEFFLCKMKVKCIYKGVLCVAVLEFKTFLFLGSDCRFHFFWEHKL